MTIASKARPAAWNTTLLSAAILGIASMGSLLSPGAALGADTKPIVNEKFTDLEPAIAELRQEAGKDRRDIVKANMLLLESEGTKFWPLYDRYRVEREAIGDQKVRMITDFAAKRDSMSEEDAQRLTKTFFSIKQQELAVKQKYLKKMSKVLSARTVARFFQIDQKLDSTIDLALAAQIPLIH